MSPLGYQSPIRTCNPPPPPELQNNEAAMADFITGTLISKNWVISILLKLLKEGENHEEGESATKVSQEKGGEEGTQRGIGGVCSDENPALADESKKDYDEKEGVGETDLENGQGPGPVDVDEELQDELCQLWDMTNNAAVARFLFDSKAVSILAKVISVTRAPRISEISVGILGNMCCVPDLCKEMSENEMLMSLIMALLSNTEFDAMTLKETMRLVYTCLSNPAICKTWVNAIWNNPFAKQLFLYIFSSSLNSELLKSTADAVDTLLDLSDDLCQEWASSDFVEAMLEAVRQIGFERSEDLTPFLHMFQLMTTSQEGAQALVENGEGVVSPLLAYLSSVCDYEIVSVSDHLSCLCSVVSVIQLLFTSDPAIAESLISKPKFFEHTLKVLEGLFRTNRHVVHADLPACEHASRKHSTDHHHHHHHQRRQSHRQRRTSEKHLDEEPGDSKEGKEAHEKDRDRGGKGDAGAELMKVASEAEDSNVKRQHSNESHKSEASDGRALDENDCEVNGERTDDANRVGMRMLYTLLQDFFRDFFNSLQLEDNDNLAPPLVDNDEDGDEDKEADADKESNPPLFVPVLKCLNSMSHKTIAYLVTTLTRNLAPDASQQAETEMGDGARRGRLDSLSEVGLRTAEHLLDLCGNLRLSWAARIIKDSIRAVK